ncbi:uncharacterized protein (TIGR02453 family) [Thermocatellispora tengchongensis]|uniref:Uncharacterized protein (TIGR02453 family) n=1 Tax=Thermocatellispora tengchongensis TaxID=1073253 RepID=A0A840P0H9_9ACTN|nr:DUF2461 domain-containing protein [Thermocatellispora tengchongensis]MBB5132489.1 uncharacterized protein (TIGR02453 family) [Thermocatellispora tengchongensis]
MEFTGFPDEAFVFYEGLEADNSKIYWGRHKALYEQAVRAPMLALAEELAGEFGEVHLFRPYRDVRFAKDKSPYKTHQGAYAATVEGIGYYVQIGADGLHVAGGFFAGGAEQLGRYREAVAEELTGPVLERIVADARAAGFTISGDRLKTRPRGFPADHPRIELLRHRSLHAGRTYEPEPWVHTPEVLPRVRDDWRALRPLVDWLTTHAKR